MNKEELVHLVSGQSGVEKDICERVLNAFEEVLSDELAHSKGFGDALDKVQQLVSFFNKRKG
ncbi:HU family DNA-binding protein [Bacillus sp. JCM 19034]|uniref:HU family DNA-binding protein n=1 Tax=Bacillus sp. JCM 19034 TaxID=1481928 RepID=UPI000786558A|nr:HU family DNA-binding protein [Bacillus sp. JCM 19034]